MKPLARWTIGNVQKDGFECLVKSISNFCELYDVEPIVCYNCEKSQLPNLSSEIKLIDQRDYVNSCKPSPLGVAWKLYPPRMAIDRYEILIDNDIIIEKKIPEIDLFFRSDCTLLLEDRFRTYGKFRNHVPKGFKINSGIYGMPPGFDFSKYVDFYSGDEWELNAKNENKESKTFDEQGLVAIALLKYRKYVIISSDTVKICSQDFSEASGYHFIGLNRRSFHKPYHLYKCRSIKLFL